MLVIEKFYALTLWLSSILLGLSFFLAIGKWVPLNVHIVISSITTLVALFASISTIFYFVGTGIWIKDQSTIWITKDREKGMRIWEIYQKANWIKAWVMPCPTMSIFMGLFTFILGGALQVGAIDKWIHITVATLFLIFTWIGHFLAVRALNQNIEYLNLTTLEIE